MIWSNFGRRWVALANALAGRNALELGTAATSDTGDFVAAGDVRELLTANRTYYVRTDGSDSNTGLTNTAGGAFLTVQAAWNVLLTIDCNGYTPTIQIADGTYSGQIVLDGLIVGAPNVLFHGNTSTPANVVLSYTGTMISVQANAQITFESMTFTASFICLNMNAPGGIVNIGTGVIFNGAASYAQLNIGGGRVNGTGNFTFASSCACWIRAQLNGTFYAGNITITFSGTPAWSSAGIIFSASSCVTLGTVTLSGSATGKRYEGTTNGVLDSLGAGTASTYFPGNSNGTTATGAQQG